MAAPRRRARRARGVGARRPVAAPGAARSPHVGGAVGLGRGGHGRRRVRVGGAALPGVPRRRCCERGRAAAVPARQRAAVPRTGPARHHDGDDPALRAHARAGEAVGVTDGGCGPSATHVPARGRDPGAPPRTARGHRLPHRVLGAVRPGGAGDGGVRGRARTLRRRDRPDTHRRARRARLRGGGVVQRRTGQRRAAGDRAPARGGTRRRPTRRQGGPAGASTEGERQASLSQVRRILDELALYYLPRLDETLAIEAGPDVTGSRADS